MADELVLYTNPMSRGRIVRWMLEEVGQPYRTEVLDYATTMKAPAYLAINPMGKVPAIAPRRRRGHRRRGDLRLSRRRFSAGRPRAAARRPAARRPITAGCSSRAGPVEAAVSNKALGFVVPPERERMMGYGTYRAGPERAGAGRLAERLSRRRQFHRRRRLCRLADRLRHDVRHDREAPGLRALLAARFRPSGMSARQSARRRAGCRTEKGGGLS